MYFRDLGNECQLAAGPDIRAIGWLGPFRYFRRGWPPWSFRRKLARHIRSAWEPLRAFGFHTCNVDFCLLLPFIHLARGYRNVFIPTRECLYIAPQLIRHYIRWHFYRPPEEFIRAVETCPAQGSAEYMELMRPYLLHWPEYLIDRDKTKENLELLDRLLQGRQKPPVPNYRIATVYAALGESDKALAWLERAEMEQEILPIFSAKGECIWPFESLRDHPRFRGLVSRLNHPE